MHRRLVTLGTLATIVIATVAPAEEVFTVKLFDNYAWRMDVAPDGETVAIAEHGPSIVLWNWRTKEIVRKLEGHTDHVESVQFSPDGKTLVSCSSDSTLRFWSADTGELKHTIETLHPATRVRISPDGKFIVVGLRQSDVFQIFDPTGKELRRLELPGPAPMARSRCQGDVHFSPDGKVMIAVNGGKGWPKFVGGPATISVWEVKDWKLRTSFVADDYSIACLDISPDGSWIAAATGRGKVAKVWKMPVALPVKETDPAEIARLIDRLDSDNFGQRESAQSALAKIGLPAREALLEAARSDSAEVSFRARAVLKKLSQGNIQPAHVLRGTPYDMHAVMFSPDGKLLACSTSYRRPGEVLLWQLGDAPRRVVTPHPKGAWCIAFTPDGKQMITGDWNGNVSLWTIEIPE